MARLTRIPLRRKRLRRRRPRRRLRPLALHILTPLPAFLTIPYVLFLLLT